MKLARRAAQLIVVHVHGADADTVTARQAAANERLYGRSTPREVVGHLQPGGVVLIRCNRQDPDASDLPTDNLRSLEAIARLTAALQEASEVGLLIATDQEQGPVRRLPAPASALLGGAALGATGDAGLAYDLARRTGRELLDVGINHDLAPVADVRTARRNPAIGDRAFGDRPELVAAMVAAQVRGYRDAGVAATAKHYPGHGAATVDSHVRLPRVDLPLEAWRQVHEPPFRAAVDAGVDAIMTAHLAAPALGAEGPATLSGQVVGRLRRDLGFEGVIVTDSLWMRAVRDDGRPDPEIALAALEAGHDLLLMPPDARGTVDAITAAVRGGRLREGQLDERIERILRVKRRLGIVA